MANKKNNKRKVVAVALGLIGIAGLSVASAATLNIDTANEVAIGSEVFAACADTALVSYDYSADVNAPSGYVVDEVTVEVTAGTCTDEDIVVTFDDHTGVSASGALSGGTFTAPLSGNVDLGANLGNVTVIIG